MLLVAFGSQIGAVLFLLLLRLHLATGPPSTGPTWVWASVLAVGFLCTAFAYLLYFRLIADIGPCAASRSPSSFRRSASLGLSGAGRDPHRRLRPRRRRGLLSRSGWW